MCSRTLSGELQSSRPDFAEPPFVGALQKISHRGPDSEGTVQVNEEHFGHARPRTLNLNSRSNPHFSYRNRRFVMAYIGKNLLLLKPRQEILHNASNTELVLVLCQANGT